MIQKIILSCVTIFFLLLGCSVRQEATIRSDGSGTASFDFELQDFFLTTVKEMSALVEENPNEAGMVFNIEQIQKDFAEQEAVTLERISSPTPSKLTGAISFDHIEEVFEEEENLIAADVIEVETEGEEKRINFHLERENFAQITSLFPIMKNPFFQMFGPMENANTTRAEYLEMIAFAFGEQGVEGVKTSTIELIVNVDGTIISQKGGRIANSSVVFTIPLLDVLLLEEPIDYSIVYK